MSGKKKTHDLHECDLDGVGVLEDGERDCSLLAPDVDVDLEALLAPVLVEVTETLLAQCGRSALGAVDFEMLATGDAFWI